MVDRMNIEIIERLERPISAQIGPVCGDSMGIFLRTLQSNIGRRKMLPADKPEPVRVAK